MGIFDFALLAWRRRWLIAGVTGIFLLLTIGLIFALPRTYRAEALLMPVERQEPAGAFSSLLGQVGGLASLAGFSLSGSDQRAEAIAVLGSRSLSEQFVRDNELLPILFSSAWDEEKQSWKDSEKAPTMGDAIRLFNKVRTVRPDLQSGLVTVRVEWHDPQLTAQWANELTRLANQLLRARAIDEADRSLDYLGHALNTANNVELRNAISTLMETHLQSKTFARVRDDFAFRVVDPAVEPDKAISPQPILMLVVAVFAGSVTGLLLAAFLEYLDTTRRARERGSHPVQ